MNAVATKNDTQLLNFSSGLPGFPDARTFGLLHTELAQEPFSIMRCVEDPELEFVVVPPHLFFGDYAPEIDDTTANRIGLNDSGDAIVLVILTVGEESADVTANLMAPIVVNRNSLEAAQVILVNQTYELRHRLFSDEAIEAAQTSEAS